MISSFNKMLVFLLLSMLLSVLLGSAFMDKRQFLLPVHSVNGFCLGHFSDLSYKVINVSDYFGETDTERIQKALDDVPEEGAIVFIPAGVWEACNLTAKSKSIIMGTIGTMLSMPDGMSLPFIIFRGQEDFAVVGVTFDGKWVSGASGIQISNSTRFQVINNTFVNMTMSAVRIGGSSVDFVVGNNVFIGCDGATILLFGCPGVREIRRFVICGNLLVNGTNNGKIGVAFADDGLIVDNYVKGCNHGIGTRGVFNLTIRGNWIEDCIDYGIYLGTQPCDFGSSNIIIENNSVVGARVGIARYYGNGEVMNVTLKNNKMIFCREFDVYADFEAAFVNNVVTSRDKVKLLKVPARFVGNVDLNGVFVIPADVTGDGFVNMYDISFVARLFGLSVGSEKWNPLADLIADGFINMLDIGFAAKCFCFTS